MHFVAHALQICLELSSIATLYFLLQWLRRNCLVEKIIDYFHLYRHLYRRDISNFAHSESKSKYKLVLENE
jgi:hypothetical protein